MQVPSKEELKRKALLIPCESKEDLHRWIRVYLDIDLPDEIVDPTSNSSPMDTMWSIYEAMLTKNPERSRFLFYAARDSYKTLGSAIIELLAILHFERDVAHMAAIESQSIVCSRYVNQFSLLPYIRDYATKVSERRAEYTRYKSSSGEVISPVEYEELPDADKQLFAPTTNFVQVVIATTKGSNSLHAQFMCVDGDTKLFTVGDARSRKVMTARGAFNRVAGRTPSGRGDTGTEEEISVPANEVLVLSTNMDTGALEFKPILRAHRKRSKTIAVHFDDGKEIVCTPDHPLYVMGKGFVLGNELVVGDPVLSIDKFKDYGPIPSRRNNERKRYVERSDTTRWEQALIGSLLGDCGIYLGSNGTGNPYLAEQHCMEQAEYLEWKKSLLSEKLRVVYRKGKSGYTGEEQTGFFTGHSEILKPYLGFRETLYDAERIDALGLAIWYMDDGCAGRSFRLSTECFSLEQNQKLVKILKDNFDIDTRVVTFTRKGKTYHFIIGPIASKRRLVEVCAPYIHPTMAYKFDVGGHTGSCRVCGKTFWYYENDTASVTCNSPLCRGVLINNGRYNVSKVTSISDNGERWVYDFTIADNNNFWGNGLLNKNCLDELDLAPRIPVEEAKMIPSQCRDGSPPVIAMTSSRKYGYGLVQEEIDEAEARGTIVLHWNLIDVAKRCPENRHLPSEPKIDIYVNDETLKALPEEDYLKLPVENKEKFVKRSGYAGCLKNCRLFAVCQGRLATRRDSKSRLLKSLPHVQNMFRAVIPEVAKAQLLCHKPSSYGLIYPYFEPDIHCLSAAQMAAKITGEEYPDSFTKGDLIELAKNRGCQFYAGMDHGFTHNFAVVTGFKDGNCMYVIDTIAAPELELSQKIEVCNDRIKDLDPIIYADPEDPASNKTLKKHFRLKEWSKKPGSVVSGIQVVRYKLNPTMGDPELFFLKGDNGCETLKARISKYHWILDKVTGKPTDVPDEAEDDECDALRYLIMNVFNASGKTIISDPPPAQLPSATTAQYTQDNWAQKIIQEQTGESVSEDSVGTSRGKKGSFLWDL